MSFFNVNSFAILGVFTLAGVAVVLVAVRAPRPAWLLWIGLALAFVAINLALRTGASTLDTPEKVEAALRGGKPTLVEFYFDL
ncbi:MAG: hypothetical protein C4309_07970 [Chloroflexota bacterium]